MFKPYVNETIQHNYKQQTVKSKNMDYVLNLQFFLLFFFIKSFNVTLKLIISSQNVYFIF